MKVGFKPDEAPEVQEQVGAHRPGGHVIRHKNVLLALDESAGGCRCIIGSSTVTVPHYRC